MGRARRRHEARDLVQRAKVLPPEQLGVIMSVLLGQALVSLPLQVALLVAALRAARRAFRVRHLGARTIVRAALPRPVIALACVYAGYRTGSRALTLRWLTRAVQRAESAPHDRGEPPSTT